MGKYWLFCSLFAIASAHAQIPEVTGTPVELAALKYIDVRIGTGEVAAPGKRFTVHYTGWLQDGKKFDSSVDRNEPFQFVQGRRQVIPGWDNGFEGMKAGGKRRLIIPYQLAYGETGTGPIPPKAELIFDVELLAVSDVPKLLPAVDVLLPFLGLEEKVLTLAKAVPEEKYSWRPAEGVRSFREVFLHIAYGTKLLLDLADKPLEPAAFRQRVEEQWKSEKAALPKQEIVRMLEESFAQVKKILEGERAGTLARDIEFFGKPTTRRGVLISLDTHTSEHLGQLIAYARMNGILPPWSQ